MSSLRPRSDLSRQAPATFLLLGAIVFVYAATALQSRSLTGNLNDSWIADHWTLYLPYMTDSWFGPLRGIGAMFLHQGLSHLLMNGLMLYLFGRELEKLIGSGLFTAMFFAGGIGSSAITVWADPESATVGASGALYALMAIALGLTVRADFDARSLLVLIAVNLGFTFIVPGVSLWGHLGGLIAGAVIALPIAFGASKKQTQLATAVGIIAGIALLLARVATTTQGVWATL